MGAETRTVGEVRQSMVEKATVDKEFRDRLLADPKAAIGDELGLAVPESLSIEVHEESPETAHLVLPPDGNLSEGELGKVAGGAWEHPDQQPGYHNIDW